MLYRATCRLVLLCFFSLFASSFAQAQPILGNYPATNIATAGSNAVVTPSATPANITSTTATTSPDFKGLLQVNPATGIVMVTNAHPAGNYLVRVKAFNSVATTSTTFSLTVGNAACSQALFTGPASTTIPVGNNQTDIVLADFNNDSKQDFALPNQNSPLVSIRLGNGSGGFPGTTDVNIGGKARYIRVADLNGDGNQDILVAYGDSSKIAIRLGDGTGNFSGTLNLPVSSPAIDIATCDFNSDGKADFATANYSNHTVSVRLGNGDGTFSTVADMPAGMYPEAIECGDFNSDGKPDMAIANYNTPGTISIRFGDGAGGFVNGNSVAVGNKPLDIGSGDFNNDGKIDLVTANDAGSSISVCFGNGLGGFSGSIELGLTRAPLLVKVNDFNGDGNQDLAITSPVNGLSVSLGNGAGGFGPFRNLALISAVYKATTGDFDNDGKIDIALANSSISSATAFLNSPNEINVQGNGVTIQDGDTTPDSTDFTDFGIGFTGSNTIRTYVIQNTSLVNLVINSIRVSGADSSFFTVISNNLPATVAAGASVSFSIKFSSAGIGVRTTTVNINNDNCSKSTYDFSIRVAAVAPPVLGSYPTTTIATPGGNAKVIPTAAPSFAAPLSAYTTPNFRGVLQVNPSTGVVTVTNAYPAGTYTVSVGTVASATQFTLVVNNPSCGTATFTTATAALPVGTGPRAIVSADFNNDGRQDIATANNSSNNVSVLLGNGTGGFTQSTTLTVSKAMAITVNDFNGDGNADLAVASYDSGRVVVRFGDGTGSFPGMLNVPVISYPASIVSADFNGDGKPDIATGGSGSSYQVAVVLNNGTGNFYGLTTVTIGGFPDNLIAGDFNTDGKTDLAATNNTASTVSICLGNGTGIFSVTAAVVAGTSPTYLALADFNKDGKQDLLISNQNSSNVSLRLGDGMGNFTGGSNIPFNLPGLPGGGLPLALTTGDFNSDSNPDFMLSVNGSNKVLVRLGNGLGGFTTGDTITVESNPRSLITGDFNGDGVQDIATANAGNNSVSVRMGISRREINILGNSLTIPDGSTTTDTANYTGFGSVATGTSLTRTFVIQNLGTDTLRINNLFLTGADSSLFLISGPGLPAKVPAGASGTFTITFLPTDGGRKDAVVNIENDDCNEGLYRFAISGRAICTNLSATNTWLGITANWNSPSNWSLGVVPNGCSVAIVNAGAPFMPQISTAAICYSLTLNNGATFTVTGTGSLTITGP